MERANPAWPKGFTGSRGALAAPGDFVHGVAHCSLIWQLFQEKIAARIIGFRGDE
jgi:hypothetical protein